MTTDPIADLLTRLRNAVKARHQKLTVPHSKMKTALADVLKAYHFIADYKVEQNGSLREIVITLNPEKKLLNLTRVSKPGQRVYIKKGDIKPLMSGYGISVLSTSKGLMTGMEARKRGMGGELLCEIW